jgi:hypothetical protein
MNNRQQAVTRNRQQQPDRPAPTIRCIECLKAIKGVPYSFAGGMACERCIRIYYQKNGYTDNLQLELRERATAAERMIKDFERSKKPR